MVGGTVFHWPRNGTAKGENMAKKASSRASSKKKPDYTKYKEMLLALRARLRGDVLHMADAALNKPRTEASGDLSSVPLHMADIGSDNYEQEFTLSLLQNEEETLQQIEAALERIANGTYGQCVECGGRIKVGRLQAIPFTDVCIKCASARETG